MCWSHTYVSQVTLEILKRYIELENQFFIGWLMKFPGVCVCKGGGAGASEYVVSRCHSIGFSGCTHSS